MRLFLCTFISLFLFGANIVRAAEPDSAIELKDALKSELKTGASINHTSGTWVFNDNLNLWTQGLHNKGGNAPTAGQTVTEFLAYAGNAATTGLYFTGTNVAEVLGGAKLTYADGINNTVSMVGIPINTWDGNTPQFDSIELQNSLMSSQNYSNWNILMEAELAIMQDIGYDIDRRNFYGHSVYNSNQTLTNTNPYFARNADGTEYIAGEYNATSWGIGLHLYGSGNTITQAADILSSGESGTGIRVEGGKNTLIINPNTKVHANGTNGNALAVTYGKDHTIVHRGDLTAEGTNGVAARFDFGDNGKGKETRGSWLWLDSNGNKKTGDNADFLNLPCAMTGSLVESFDVTGSLR